MNELIKQVEQWSINKGLDKAESSKQFLKVVEEVGEVAAALARNDMEALQDGIGDVVVTLIILAQQNDMDLHECLQCAYDEIEGRTGKLIEGESIEIDRSEMYEFESTTPYSSNYESPITGGIYFSSIKESLQAIAINKNDVKNLDTNIV